LKVIELDASEWKDPVEFYDAVYDALGDPRAVPAPHQFGHSLDALLDVVIYGGMAYLEPPYAFRIVNFSKAPLAVQEEIDLVLPLVTRLGTDIGVSMVVVDR
jgi:hypothetical protein